MWQPVLTLGITVLTACQPSPPSDPVPPHESFTITSRHLGEDRVVNVCRPPATFGTGPFDVVYMPDGGLDEDLPHIAQTLTELMGRGEIAPVLLVGIPNTQRRRDLTPPTQIAKDREVAPVVGGSAAFRAFLRDELIPAVSARYSVTQRRSIVGESLAALFIVETLLTSRELFHGYIAISPSLWWNSHELVTRAQAVSAGWGEHDAALYLTCADEADIAPHTDTLAATLRQAAPAGLRFTYDPRKTEQHHTVFRATKAAGFRAVLRGK